MENKKLIPLIDDDLQLIRLVEFVDNLTSCNVPDYVNYNCLLGLMRCDEGVLENEYVIMYYDKRYPDRSYAEILTPMEAWNECYKRGKLELAYQLRLKEVVRNANSIQNTK